MCKGSEAGGSAAHGKNLEKASVGEACVQAVCVTLEEGGLVHGVRGFELNSETMEIS